MSCFLVEVDTDNTIDVAGLLTPAYSDEDAANDIDAVGGYR